MMVIPKRCRRNVLEVPSYRDRVLTAFVMADKLYLTGCGNYSKASLVLYIEDSEMSRKLNCIE